MPKKTFRDKIVVVTGAASGIGLAICRRFSQDGANIGMLDVDGPGVTAVENELTGQGVSCLGVTCDVSRQEESTAAIQRILDHSNATRGYQIQELESKANQGIPAIIQTRTYPKIGAWEQGTEGKQRKRSALRELRRHGTRGSRTRTSG